MKSVKQHIGKIVKRHRIKQGMSQQELADLLNIDRQYVWKIEKGMINLTLEYLDRIISKLKCSHEDFFNSKK
jgi:transcriptional regulator with XRE-family HTH domain